MNPFRPKDQNPFEQQRSAELTPMAQIAVEVAGGTVLLGLGAFVLAGLYAVYVVAQIPAVALAVVALFMGIAILDAATQTKGNRWTIILTGAAALIATVWGYAAIVAFSYQPVALPGWIATLLYGAALAVGVWKELDRAQQIIAVLLGLLMISVTTSLLAVPGRDEATGEPPGFSVFVSVEDERSADRNSKIVANCTLLDAWSIAGGVAPSVDPKIVDGVGHAGPWKFPFGHPFKAVLCTLVGQREVEDTGAPDETRAVSKTLYFPLPGGSYTLNMLVFDSDAL